MVEHFRPDGVGGEDERHALTGLDGEVGLCIPVVDGVEIDRRREMQHQIVGLETESALVLDDDGVRLAPVIEPRRNRHAELHGAAHAGDPTDDPRAMVGIVRARDRHEVLDLGDAVLAQEAGDEHVGVGEVELPRGDLSVDGFHGPGTAAAGVEQRTEHTRRVEPRTAEPVDPPVDSHDGRGTQVPDDTVVGDRQIVTGGVGRRRAVASSRRSRVLA